MWRPHPHAANPKGIVQAVAERLRGRRQLLVRGGEGYPLLLLGFPQGALPVAQEIETAFAHTLPRLKGETRAPYARVLSAIHPMVVVLLRPRNVCGCLGHHHPRGTESRLTRRLQSDLGTAVGEIDLAYESIREWRPLPISALAAGALGGRFKPIHFHAAVLAVLLHELEHLAMPDTGEHDIRLRSNRFYAEAMEQLIADEQEPR